MRILDSEIPYDEIAKYCSDTDKINTISRYTFDEGKAKGYSVIDISTGSGLRVIITPDRGLDILSASYRGANLSFMSKNGLTCVSAASVSEEFLHFHGGMLTTCGLRNTGTSCVDNGEKHPLHGRFDTIPAQEVCAFRADDDTVIVTGIIRETALFGCNLKTHRCIKISNSDSSISVEDTVTNLGENSEEIMILYHYNFGYPMIQDGCYVTFQKNDKVSPRNEEFAADIENNAFISSPLDNYKEQVYFHLQKPLEGKMAKVILANPIIGIEAELSYDTETLPILGHWKSMKSGDYALGLEPSNNYIMGRVEERKNGTLLKLDARTTQSFRTCLKISGI